MKIAVWIIALLLVSGNVRGAMASEEDVLDRYLWKNRIILVYAPSAEDSSYQRFVSEIRDDSAGVWERHLVVFHLFSDKSGHEGENELSAEQVGTLLDRYKLNADTAVAVLIGKDGGEKARQAGTLNLTALFQKIDAMPMRRREMREQRPSP
jgi:hypothetical protein